MANINHPYPRQNPSHHPSQHRKVPYFVLHLPDGRSKALFTVPSDLAEVLVLHPIMARGACFELQVDVVSQGRVRTKESFDDSSSTSFLSTEFFSPRPEETAHAISERIGIRMANPAGTTTAFEGLLGMR
ncbi:hypothetical protein IV203_000739 [Nitzschia inconspicua]|uniref:Uncharacterized protein n=1 Tax=Nitzschia inconspicua TaxID=303405 RepID=A0A9K3PQY5_9STRA|nr:hypothetical protein IV203_000739 [Nitzschia inconspicua]